jgi:hypothetical protein
VAFVLSLLSLAHELSGPLRDRLRILDVVQLFLRLLQSPGRRWRGGLSWVRIGHRVPLAKVGGWALTLRLATSAGEAIAGGGPYYLSNMATIVLRVRLLGGENTDLTYEDPDQDDEGALIDQVVEEMRTDSGVLRCRHGDRLVAVFSRGVASIEVSPRGAIV